jgi:catechol-2,3-dioxygenase
MEITDVALPTADPAAAGAFYGEGLGLPVAVLDGGAAIAVQVGATRLRLERRPGASGSDHVAFLIPADRFADAKRWLSARVPLLALDGTDEFEGPPGWNSRSLYFSGPDDAVLELIARLDLPDSGSGGFGSGDLLAISEVGIGVPDVPEAAARLGRAGLEPFAAAPAPDFAAVGDQRGLLILAAEGRPWLPTRDRRAAPRNLAVLGRGDRPAEVRVGAARIRLADRRARG